MKLTAYVMDGYKLNIRPAPLQRDWMDNTPEKYAYRCLPINIANFFGWEILLPSSFSAVWDGKKELASLWIRGKDDSPAPATSHFGSGILTFYLPCLFQTEPGMSLMVQGPINRFKDGIAPITGVVETDWSPYTFTMNWRFTHPCRVEFEKDEPFCHIFPVSCSMMESVTPEVKALADNPELRDKYDTWSQSRNKFIADLHDPDSEAKSQGWQKMYYRGHDPSGCPVQIDGRHRTKLRLREFADAQNNLLVGGS